MCIESLMGLEANLGLSEKGFLAGHRIAEMPSVCTDRTDGESQFGFWRWLPNYLVWYFFAFRTRRRLSFSEVKC